MQKVQTQPSTTTGPAALNEEENKLYDRQLRVWGQEVQQKIKASKVWIQPMTPANVDLAKNLILAGISVTIFDNAKVSERDFEDNPLIVEADIGGNRGSIIAKRLQAMNSLVKITSKPAFSVAKTPEDYVLNAVKPFNALTINTNSFAEMAAWDRISKKANIPLYILVSCGQFGFVYISLGREYVFLREKKEKLSMGGGAEDVEVIEEEEDDKVPMEEVRIRSLAFEEAFVHAKKIRRTAKVFFAI